MKYPIGTRIRFLKHLYGAADDYQPAHDYAFKGELGNITGHNEYEGYMVKRDSWPNPFGAIINVEFEVIDDTL